ncbi:hypothetical protein ACWEIJ_19980 [Lentzea sp. NPDC004789]
MSGEAAPTAATLDDLQRSLSERTCLTLRPLTGVYERDEYIFGDPASGRFFSVPRQGATMLRGLTEGLTIGSAAAQASTETAQVDGLDFARMLLSIGFVDEVDGVPVANRSSSPSHVPLNAVAAWLGRLLFSRPALVAYGILFLLVLAIWLTHPALQPNFEDLFLHPQPAVSFGIVFALSIGTAMAHELCHWWSARSLGVPARIRISRRLYFPVMETDVTGLWSLPAKLRYPPFLAGMALDVVLLAFAVGTRLVWSLGLVDVPGVMLRILGALAAIKLFDLMFQCLVFLRTDLYAVMITVLGLRNLAAVNRLYLKKLFRIAKPADIAQLDSAHSRDLAASRWYSACYLIGLLWAAWFFKAWFYPSSFVIITWMSKTLRNAPPGSDYWWQAAAVAAMVSMNIIWPLAVLFRERAARKGALT